jgi:hypothetical protein
MEKTPSVIISVSVPVRRFLQDALAVLHILVLENFDRRFRKPRPIDDRRMIQLVRNDEIVFAKNGRYGSRVGRKARLKHHAGFHILECRNLLFQFHVQLHRAGDRSNRTRARAVPFHRVQRGLPQRLVRRESQIIVRS